VKAEIRLRLRGAGSKKNAANGDPWWRAGERAKYGTKRGEEIVALMGRTLRCAADALTGIGFAA
jgi:hypothetical protein